MIQRQMSLILLLQSMMTYHTSFSFIIPTEQDFLTDNRMTWIEAENHCLSTYNSHLISIHSSDTFHEIQSKIHAISQDTHSFWIGLANVNPYNNTISTPPHYIWSDETVFEFGSTLGSFPWFDEQPKSPQIDTKVRLWGNSAQLLWDDVNENDVYFWICNDSPSISPTEDINVAVEYHDHTAASWPNTQFFKLTVIILLCVCFCVTLWIYHLYKLKTMELNVRKTLGSRRRTDSMEKVRRQISVSEHHKRPTLKDYPSSIIEEKKETHETQSSMEQQGELDRLRSTSNHGHNEHIDRNVPLKPPAPTMRSMTAMTSYSTAAPSAIFSMEAPTTPSNGQHLSNLHQTLPPVQVECHNQHIPSVSSLHLPEIIMDGITSSIMPSINESKEEDPEITDAVIENQYHHNHHHAEDMKECDNESVTVTMFSPSLPHLKLFQTSSVIGAESFDLRKHVKPPRTESNGNILADLKQHIDHIRKMSNRSGHSVKAQRCSPVSSVSSSRSPSDDDNDNEDMYADPDPAHFAFEVKGPPDLQYGNGDMEDILVEHSEEDTEESVGAGGGSY